MFNANNYYKKNCCGLFTNKPLNLSPKPIYLPRSLGKQVINSNIASVVWTQVQRSVGKYLLLYGVYLSDNKLSKLYPITPTTAAIGKVMYATLLRSICNKMGHI